MRRMTAPVHDHADLHRSASDDALAAALEALKGRGERVTSSRRAVLEVLAASGDHLAADDVAERLAASEVHRATVYRTLDLLTDAGVVLRRNEPGGAAQYHLAAAGTGHDHLHGHCDRCGTVVPLPIGALDGAVAAVSAATGFVIDPAHSTLAGTCARCALG